MKEIFLTVDICHRDQINDNYMVNAKSFPLTPYIYTFKLETLNIRDEEMEYSDILNLGQVYKEGC